MCQGNLGNFHMRLNEYVKAVAYFEPHSHSSASACLDDRVHEAAKWLQTAFDGGQVLNLQNCTWRNLTLMRAKRTRRWRISKSTSRGA